MNDIGPIEEKFKASASHQLVARVPAHAGYSLQANRKMREGPDHPDRDAQFRYIKIGFGASRPEGGL